MKILQIALLIYLFGTSSVLIAENSPTITYEDIVKFSKPQKIIISPDASKIAYVVRTGDLETNENIDTVYLHNIQEDSCKEVAKFSSLLQMDWDSQSKSIYILSKNKLSFSIGHYSSSGCKLLVKSFDPITIFQVDATDTNLVYSKTVYDAPEVIQNRLENGYVYKWEEDSISTLCSRSYRKKVSEEIILVHLPSGDSESLTSISYGNFFNADIDFGINLIDKIAISPNMRYIAFDTYRIGQIELGECPWSKEIVVWDHQSHTWLNPPGKMILGTKQNPCWIEPEKLVFQLDSTTELSSKLFTFDCSSEQVQPLSLPQNFPIWGNTLISNKNKLIILSSTQATVFCLTDNSYETIQLPETIFTQNSIIHPSIDNEAQFVVTFPESSNVAPEVVLYNIAKKDHKTLSNLNPWLNQKQLGHVEKIVFTTKNGIQSIGYLVHPVHEKPGIRYPLIIGTYGFSGGFILDAEWHTTFPAQVLAGEGYLVLLLNDAPGQTQNLIGDPDAAMKSEGWNLLELFEHAVLQLVEQGVADSEKVGLYGWSHGGFMVNFLISHSSKFQAACYGEGADYNPSEYWISGNSTWAKILDNTFGGPPWGETLKNYQDFCPFFNIEKINTPVLIEFADIGCIGHEFEMYVPLRLLHKPAELVLYKDEMHNFVRPKSRLASMKRKVDWFNFWLLDKKDSNPTYKEQYARWEAMRNESVIKKSVNSSI